MKINTKLISLAFNVIKKDALANLGILFRSCFNAPYAITLSITDRCNARCITCNRWQFDTASQELSIETWKNLLSDLAKFAKHCQVAFTGGEPFMKEGFLELLKSSEKMHIYNKVITNGAVFKKGEYEEILKAGVDFILFSLNSIGPEIHNRYKGVEGLHQTITEAIKYIKSKNRKIKIGVLFIITKDNFKELDAFASWIYSIGVDSIDFQPIRDNFWPSFKKEFPISASTTNPLWQIADLNELDRQIDLLLEKKKRGFPIEPTIQELKEIKVFFRNPGAISHTHHCTIGFRNLIILPNGDVQLCQYFPVIGNISKDNLKKIWFSNEARLQRLEMLKCEKPCLAACVRQYSFYDKVRSFLIRLR